MEWVNGIRNIREYLVEKLPKLPQIASAGKTESSKISLPPRNDFHPKKPLN